MLDEEGGSSDEEVAEGMTIACCLLLGGWWLLHILSHRMVNWCCLLARAAGSLCFEMLPQDAGQCSCMIDASKHSSS
jgi:hypothetical protein